MMLCVKIAQLLAVCFQLSFRPAPLKPAGAPSSVPMFVKPLLVNGGFWKFTSPIGGPKLKGNRAKAASAGAFAPANGRIALATAVLKQVGDAPGARMLAGTPGLLAKFAATRQFA